MMVNEHTLSVISINMQSPCEFSRIVDLVRSLPDGCVSLWSARSRDSEFQIVSASRLVISTGPQRPRLVGR